MQRFLRQGGLAVLASVASALATPGLHAQDGSSREAWWEIAGVPAVNYDADEGVGYGAMAEVFRHRAGAKPYAFTVQPAVLLSTRGRRDVTVFFDAPHLLRNGWRVDAFAGREQQLASPYYGLGNEAVHDEALDHRDGLNPYYYRFGRTRTQALVNGQRPVGSLPVRVLIGAGVSHVSIDATPFDEGTTLLAEQFGGGPLPGGYSNSVRAGLIWDTRDRELGPSRGAWSELLVQRVDAALGSDFEYTRWTVTDRRYVPIGSDRVVFANRFLLQGIQGDPPFYELFVVQTSFKQQEGLGGAKTIRGLPKNRYAGKGLVLWNAEMRWRAAEFQARGKPMHLVLSGFVDSGRVWDDRIVLNEIAQGVHHGVGGGIRVGVGESFVVAVDLGRTVGAGGSAAGVPIYIGLGYLY
jgi:hypothetical protein